MEALGSGKRNEKDRKPERERQRDKRERGERRRESQIDRPMDGQTYRQIEREG